MSGPLEGGGVGSHCKGCECEMLGQTVPSTNSSDREGPNADGEQQCTTDSQRQCGSGAKVSSGFEISRSLELTASMRKSNTIHAMLVYLTKAHLLYQLLCFISRPY